MDEQKALLVRGWLSKAQRDLDSARRLANDSDAYFDSAAYHCQQAAEKAIKAYLVWIDRRVTRTHDLRLLIGEAASSESGFLAWLDAADLLTPMATLYRYPGEHFQPSADEYAEAISAAEGLVNFVRALIAGPVAPGAELRVLGDTTTLADPGVVASLKEKYASDEG